MKHLFLLLFFFGCVVGHSQIRNESKQDKNQPPKDVDKPKKAAYNQYRIITLQKDTTYVDTSLTIKKEYEFNYLRRDIFGLLPFANEGQSYSVLDFGVIKKTSFPEIGFSGKHFNFLRVEDIKYYSVATPITDLYFKTVMEQGQSLDAFITVNTSPRFNFSIAYKGIRSLGKYINQLSSSGNFRFTSSYNTLNKRYYLNFHYTGQDLLNGENGGITTTDNFESGDPDYSTRARFQVYLTDATSFLKGKRFFIDHNFRLNAKKSENNLYISHQFNFENKLFEFNQPTVQSYVGTNPINRFGDSYLSANIIDQTVYNRMYNKVGAIYENMLLGKFQFFAEDFIYNNFYSKVLVINSNVIPSSINDRINTIGGQYEYRKNKWNGSFQYSNSISKQSMTNFDAKLKYTLNDKNEFLFQYQLMNKVPDHLYQLHQSSYVSYNWNNNFNNEIINNLNATAKTQWLDASLQISSLKNHLYFSDDGTNGQQIVTPKQYNPSINYLSIKASREFKYWKLSLDNTILYQQVDQKDAILNVPKLVLRNSFYYTDYFFKKAMYLQSGFTLNYFSKFYMNDYNPILAEAFVQNSQMLGGFPLIDFFINARVRQTRIFLKAEHFNSGFSGFNYYSAPNYPYRDFIIRFGLVWNFFQ